jgi:3-methyl-2-oxobutanoate hydroxymethyltransferase
MKKITIKEIIKKKGIKPICCLTSYTSSVTKIIDKYCDIILVGDSLGMVLYGMKTTRDVKLETMIVHAKAVKNSAKQSLVVVDMPYKTYTNKFKAFKNAKKIINSTKCDAVKLEGGEKIFNIIKYLTKRKIPVMGHIGFLPQHERSFTKKGKNTYQREKILKDASSLEKAGVFAIVLECIIQDLAKKITKSIKVPTIGIGSSKYCDGQILVIDDIIGMSGFKPRFVKQYSNVKKIIEKSVQSYIRDVKNKKFPSSSNTYKF